MQHTEGPPSRAGTEARLLVSRRAVLRGMAVAAVLPTLLLETDRSARAQSLGPPGNSAVPFLPRSQHAAAAIPGGVLVAGGFADGPLSDVQVYRDGLWYSAAPMATPRYQHAAVALGDGRVLVLGGLNQGPMSDAEIYDPASDSWSPAPPMSLPRYQHSAVALGGSVLITGGLYAGTPADPEVYGL